MSGVYAKIVDGVVQDILIVNPSNVGKYEGLVFITPDVTQCPIGIGWTYDGENFINPNPQEVEDELN